MANNQQLLLGEGAGSAPAVYIEEVFSTYLYAGNDSTQTITNNIDLSTKGGLVWTKQRTGTQVHVLVDTVRGNNKRLQSNSTAAEDTTSSLMSFNSDGYDIPNSYGILNSSGHTYASWTFRKQPKFFDIVTYTGNGSARTIAHNLGSAPGMIIIKRTTDLADWWVWHRTFSANEYVMLNSTAAKAAGANSFTSSDSTGFTIGSESNINGSANSYVAYLFAHDAGGFGLAGTDNVISCGSMTVDGSGNATANLGYEPQFVIYKMTSAADDWRMFDTMRGLTASNGSNTNPYALLRPNTAGAEGNFTGQWQITSTGLQLTQPGNAGQTYIYIAIRRGPMKVPTVGTSVYSAIRRSGTGAVANVTGVGFTPDQTIVSGNVTSGGGYQTIWVDRLRGSSQYIRSALTNAEVTDAVVTSLDMDGVTLVGTGASLVNASGSTYINWYFRRAPGFFDEVCWTGTNADQTLTHNLTVAPELIIYKVRGTGGYNWEVSSNFAASNYVKTILNLTNASSTLTYVGGGSISAQPTATQFSVGQYYNPASTMVAYLFATCAGVSKVGSYTGNGSSQTIACGFTAGSRFVMIKRTDSTGDWYVWDSARGIVAGNDPHLSLNTTAAEVTTDDSVDTDNSGFIVNQLSATNVNVSSASYIFLAVS